MNHIIIRINGFIRKIVKSHYIYFNFSPEFNLFVSQIGIVPIWLTKGLKSGLKLKYIKVCGHLFSNFLSKKFFSVNVEEKFLDFILVKLRS